MSVGAVEALKDQARPLPLELHTAVRANVRSFVAQANWRRRRGGDEEVKYELAATAAEA